MPTSGAGAIPFLRFEAKGTFGAGGQAFWISSTQVTDEDKIAKDLDRTYGAGFFTNTAEIADGGRTDHFTLRTQRECILRTL